MSDWTTSLGGMFKAAVVVKLMLQNGQISSLTDESQFLFTMQEVNTEVQHITVLRWEILSAVMRV